jgi:WD40 repeat protein
LAVGFGNNKKLKGKVHPKEGALLIINYENLRILQEKKDSNAAIYSLRYSPNGKTLAAGSEDCCIYLYNLEDNCTLKHVIRTHEAPISNIDFSRNSEFLCSVDTSGKTCYNLVSVALPVLNLTDLSTTDWQLNSNPYSWQSRGFWLALPPDRRVVAQSSSSSLKFIAAANGNGYINIANYPMTHSSGFLSLGNHVGDVSSLRWVMDDSCFFTAGRTDSNIIQWKVFVHNQVVASSPSNHVVGEKPKEPVKEIEEDDCPLWRSMISGYDLDKAKLDPLRFNYSIQVSFHFLFQTYNN